MIGISEAMAKGFGTFCKMGAQSETKYIQYINYYLFTLKTVSLYFSTCVFTKMGALL